MKEIDYNPVAKHSRKFNKPKRHDDEKNDYRRHKDGMQPLFDPEYEIEEGIRLYYEEYAGSNKC